MGLFDFLGGGGDSGFDDARAAVERNRALYQGIELPEYQEFIPELYGNESFNYQTIQDDPYVKSRQEQLLAEMAGLKDTGLTAADEAGFAKARNVGNQMAKANTGAAIQDAQNRGVGGSGLEFALREMAGQGGAQRANEAALQQAADSARQRALYTQAYGDQLSGMRDQNYRQSAANTNIINDFNAKNTQARNQTANANVDARNDAFGYNQGLKDKNYQNQMRRADAMAGLNNQQADIGMAEADQQRRKRGAVGGAIGAGVVAAFGGPVGAGVGAGVGSALF